MNLTQFLGIDPVIDDRYNDISQSRDKEHYASANLAEATTSENAAASVETKDSISAKELFQTQKMESLGTLAGGIAHDMNNMLGPIMTAARTIKSHGNLALEFTPLLDVIIEMAERGGKLNQQILAFSRGSEIQFEDLKLSSVTDELVKMMNQAMSKNITLDINVPADLRMIRGDPSQLLQVLLNLCINARDAMPTGGVLSVRAANVTLKSGDRRLKDNAKPGQFVEINVLDTGVGIPDAVRSRIFEPFFTTKTLGKGTGLGLAVVYGIVKKQGGSISVISEVGKGTQFTVLFPASSANNNSLENPPSGLTSLSRSQGKSTNQTILLVEDDAAIRLTIKEMLTRAGYTVVLAAGGTEAIEVLRSGKHHVDVVITDIYMPDMDGWETIKAIREVHPAMPVAAISGHARYLRSEFSDQIPFLSKPFSNLALIETIQSLSIKPGD